jgi:predicted AAA+ superfamily ATPase
MAKEKIINNLAFKICYESGGFPKEWKKFIPEAKEYFDKIYNKKIIKGKNEKN